jgi:hypothetical protein
VYLYGICWSDIPVNGLYWKHTIKEIKAIQEHLHAQSTLSTSRKSENDSSYQENHIQLCYMCVNYDGLFSVLRKICELSIRGEY